MSTPTKEQVIERLRADKMYRQLNVDCLGMVANMSYYVCPQCGHRDEIFDHGGAQAAAKELGVPFLGSIPLNAGIRRIGDAGRPPDARMAAATLDTVVVRDSICGQLD